MMESREAPDTKKKSVEDLPTEVLQHALTFATIPEVCTCQRLSHYWDDTIRSNDLWEQLIERDLTTAARDKKQKWPKVGAKSDTKAKKPREREESHEDAVDGESAHPILDESEEGAQLVLKKSVAAGTGGMHRKTQGHVVSARRYRDRRLKDLYQMVFTGKFVEKRFEDRPRWQRILIVLGSIVLSPLLLVYLTPKIIRGVYRNAIVPSFEMWGEMFGDASAASSSTAEEFQAAAHSWAASRKKRFRATKKLRFRDRPLWCQALMILLTIIGSPYWILRYSPAITRRAFRQVKRVVSWIMAKFIRPVVDAINRVVTKTLRWIRDAIVLPAINFAKKMATLTKQLVVKTLCWIRDTIVLPAIEFVKKMAVLTKQRAIDPSVAFAKWATVEVVYRRFLIGVVYAWVMAPSGRGMKRFYKAVRLSMEAVRDTANRFLEGAETASDEFVKMVTNAATKAAQVTYDNAIVPAARETKAFVLALGRVSETLAKLCWEEIIVPVAMGTWEAVCTLGRWTKILATWLYNNVVRPVGRAIKAAGIAIYKAVCAAATFAWQRILCPIGRAIKAAILAICRAIRITGLFVWDRLLVPLGRGIKTAVVSTVNLIVGSVKAIARAIRITGSFVWQRVLCPVGRAIKSGALFITRSIRICGTFVWERLLRPTGHGLLRAAKLIGFGIAACFLLTYHNVVLPTVAAIQSGVRQTVSAIRTVKDFFWNRILCPVGRGIKATARTLYFSVIVPSVRALVSGARFLWYDIIVSSAQFTARFIKTTLVLARDDVIKPCFFVAKSAVTTAGSAAKSGVLAVNDAVVQPVRYALVGVVLPNIKFAAVTAKDGLFTTAREGKDAIVACYDATKGFFSGFSKSS